MHIKLGFVQPPNSTSLPDFGEIYNALIKDSRPSLVSAPPVRIRGLRSDVVYSVHYRPKVLAQSAQIRLGPCISMMTKLVPTRRRVRTVRLRMMKMMLSSRLPCRTTTTSSQVVARRPSMPHQQHPHLHLCLPLHQGGPSYHQSRRFAYDAQHRLRSLRLVPLPALLARLSPNRASRLLLEAKRRDFQAHGADRRANRMSWMLRMTSLASSCLRSMAQRTSRDGEIVRSFYPLTLH